MAYDTSTTNTTVIQVEYKPSPDGKPVPLLRLPCGADVTDRGLNPYHAPDPVYVYLIEVDHQNVGTVTAALDKDPREPEYIVNPVDDDALAADDLRSSLSGRLEPGDYLGSAFGIDELGENV